MGLKHLIADLADRLINHFAPLDGADWLTRVEADIDVLGPQELLRVAEECAASPPRDGAAGQRTPASPCEGAGRPPIISAFPSTWQTKWADLPTLRMPVFWTDDDNEFQSDMTYLRGLLSFLADQADDGGQVRPIPAEWSRELARKRDELKTLK